MQTPLRYPGGKSDFSVAAFEILQRTGQTGLPLIEPYAGSAAVSLALLNAEATPHATLVERDPLIYSFWVALTRHADELFERFIELPITLETWHRLRPLLAADKPDPKRIVEFGLAGLFFNRANFSGILSAGPIGGMQQKSAYTIDCRTNKDEIISRLLSISTLSDRIDVKFGDAINVLKHNSGRKDVFVYVDPPYYEKGELLYRYHYGTKEHRQLATYLKAASFPWLLSYDVHHVIEFLYEGCNVQKIRFRYSAHSPKNHDELLISNFRIPFKLSVVRLARSVSQYTAVRAEE